MVKKTYGQVVEETLASNQLEDDIREYSKAMAPSSFQDVKDCAFNSSRHPLYANRDFYIVGLVNAERMANNMPRWRVWARRSPPTPVYKQHVWKYHHQSASLEYLWSIPDQLTYYYLIRNYHKLPQEHKQRAQFCILMEEGKLLEWVMKENGEKKDAVILQGVV